VGRCCLGGTAGWDRPGALWRHWRRPVAQPRVRGDRPTRFGLSRFWAVLAGSSRPTAPDGHESILVQVDFCRFWPEVVGLLLPTGPNRCWCKSNLVDFGRKWWAPILAGSSRPSVPSEQTLTGRRCAGSSPFETHPSALYSPRRLLHVDGEFWRFGRRSILLGRNRLDSLGAVGLLLPASRADFGPVDEIDFAVFSITDVRGRSRTVAVTERPWRGLWGAGGVLRQPPKPAQVSRSYRELPG